VGAHLLGSGADAVARSPTGGDWPA
jgi:hypothetical protein